MSLDPSITIQQTVVNRLVRSTVSPKIQFAVSPKIFQSAASPKMTSFLPLQSIKFGRALSDRSKSGPLPHDGASRLSRNHGPRDCCQQTGSIGRITECWFNWPYHQLAVSPIGRSTNWINWPYHQTKCPPPPPPPVNQVWAGAIGRVEKRLVSPFKCLTTRPLLVQLAISPQCFNALDSRSLPPVDQVRAGAIGRLKERGGRGQPRL